MTYLYIVYVAYSSQGRDPPGRRQGPEQSAPERWNVYPTTHDMQSVELPRLRSHVAQCHAGGQSVVFATGVHGGGGLGGGGGGGGW